MSKIHCPSCGTYVCGEAQLGMTRRQREVLTFITLYNERNDFSPSYQEIMDGTGMSSKSNVHRVIHALKDRGYVALLPGCARSIVVLSEREAA